jgi:hypothetical protein
VEVLVGYWLCAHDPVTVTVRGLSPNDTGMQLHPGWNLVGPPREMAAPDAAAMAKPVWWWDSASYQTASRVYPGLGYWIYCREPVAWRFGE